MMKHVKIRVDYTTDDENDYLEDDIKDGLAERLGLYPDDIDVEID